MLPLASVYMCTYTTIMHYAWDDQKAAFNRAKHGIDFADAVTVLEDEAAITLADEFSDEERFITIGMDAWSDLSGCVYMAQ